MDDVAKLKQEIERLRSELYMFYQMGNAMRTTLELEQIFFISLTAVTSHEGLGFNRAMLFLVNERDKSLEGKMGIGPNNQEDAYRIWEDIRKRHASFQDLIEDYNVWQQERRSELHELVKSVKLPLEEKSGILALTVLEGMPWWSTQDRPYEDKTDPVFSLFNSEYFACVPLMAKNEPIGVILADNIFSNRPITSDDIRILSMLGDHAGLAIENSKLYEDTVTKSHMDGMTQTWNHGCFQELLIVGIEKAMEEESYLSLIMIDIDNFKKCNDTFGHTFGDRILKDISGILKQNSRHCDHVCRYGGEEFVVILPGANKKEAHAIAERLRKSVESYSIPKQENTSHSINNVTVSLGVSTFPEDSKDRYDLIVKADQALYRAKRSGKNQTCVNGHDTQSLDVSSEVLKYN